MENYARLLYGVIVIYKRKKEPENINKHLLTKASLLASYQVNK